MLSAIFGNILGYNTKVEEPIANEDEANKFSEASTQTSDNKSTSTQVNLDESKHNESTNNNKSCQDWVIVDDITENDKACGDDVEMNQESQEPAEANEDPLIGSFFQKNEVDENMPSSEQSDKTVETQTVLPAKKETWLITPLPCLTSITEGSQQKSMIDNDPLENLLIEQPTRFMSTSTTVENTASTTPKRKSQARKQQKSKATEEVMQSDDCFIENLFNEQPATPVMQRSIAEKRKEAEKSVSPVSPTPSNEYPKKISRKAAKSLKKSAGQHQKSVNKENMQVKSLLMAECFGKDGQKNNVHGRYGQMTRANKNAALFGLAGNARTRKFHNLQQPSMTIAAKNQKF